MIDYTKYFPYKTMRKEQNDVLKQVSKHWNTKKYFILQLDVGTGKSGIAKTIANWCSNAFIITQTKQLQDQYIHEFKHEGDILSMKGKMNYSCNENPKLTCENGMCVDLPAKQQKKLACRAECKYYKLREQCTVSPSVVTSYAYIFRAFECAGFWKRRELCVFDECHAFEDQMVEFASFSIDINELYKLGVRGGIRTIRFHENQELKTLNRIQSLIEYTRNNMFNKIKRYISELKDPDNITDEIMNVIKEKYWAYYQLDKLYKKIEIFFENNIKDWLFSIENNGLKLICKPIEIGDLFYKYASPIAEKFVFMSATILDTEQFRKTLRLPEEDCLIINIGSTFDPKNSPIYCLPCGNMTLKHLNSSLPKVYSTIDKILKEHNNERGIIHTVSYDIAKKINMNTNSNKRYTLKHNNETNEELIEEHSENRKSVLVSPSMTTGVDLKDDLSRFQIIVKLPWKSLADKRTKVKAQRNFNWYACEMLKVLVQACGRSTRSKTDWSETYILDEKFPKWIKKYKSILPEQFVKRIHFEED